MAATSQSYTAQDLADAGGLSIQSVRRRVAKGEFAADVDGRFRQDAYDIMVRTRRVHEQKDLQARRLRRARAAAGLANVRKMEDRIALLETGTVPRAPVLEETAARADRVMAELAGLIDRNVDLVRELLGVDTAKAVFVLRWMRGLVEDAVTGLKDELLHEVRRL
jgi:hypothetical protein